MFDFYGWVKKSRTYSCVSRSADKAGTPPAPEHGTFLNSAVFVKTFAYVQYL